MLHTGLGFTILSTIIVAALYLYLYSRERDRALLIWAASWVIYSFRFAIQLGMVSGLLPPWTILGQEAFTMAAGLLFHHGTCLFLGRQRTPAWTYLAVAAFAWTTAAVALSASFLIVNLPAALLVGAIFVWDGWLFLQNRDPRDRAEAITGTALLLWGLHKLNYPLLRPLDWFASWGFIVAACLFLVAGGGIVLSYNERSRRRLEEEIRQRQREEARFRSVIESSSDAVIVSDSRGVIVLTNNGATAMFGYSAAELAGLPLHRLMPERYRDDHGKGMARLLNTGQTSYLDQTLSFHGLRKDGSEFPLDLTVNMWENDGQVFFSGILRDTSLLRQTERDLRQQNLLLSALINSIPDLIYYKNRDSVYLGCNEAFREFVGRPTAEIVGNTDYSFFPHHLAELYRSRDQALLASDATQRSEEWVSYPDGRKILLDTVKTPYYDDNDAVIGLIGISRDITAKKTAEERLAGNLTLLNAIIEGSTDAIFAKDQQGRYLIANATTLRIMGARKEEVIGRDDGAIFPVETAEQIKMIDRRVMTSGEAMIFEETLQTAGGPATFLTSKNPLQDSGGATIGVIGIARDVTERIRQQEEARQSRQLLDNVFASIQDGISVLDRELTIVKVNPVMNRLYPHMVPLEGRKCHEAYHGRREPCTICPTIRAFKSGALETEEVPLVSPAGPVGTLELFAFPIKDEQGTVTGIVEYVRDVTRKKAAEKEKNKLESQLRQSQKMEAIGTLAGGIAHDFNNILVPILGYTEMLIEKEAPESSRKNDLQEVYRAATRARDLIRQILTFSRQTEHERKPLLIEPIVKECVKLLQSTTPKTIEISYQGAAADAIIEADPTHVNQIMMNLCTNAIYAMRQTGGTLSVSLAREAVAAVPGKIAKLPPGNYVCLKVRDTGSGIDPATLSRIFEPYFTTKPLGEGTGMGLSVVHGLVKSYGGEITANSAPDKGATFKVYLPLYEQTPPEPAPGAEPGEIPVGRGEHILFVDDEEAIVNSLSRSLEGLGYRVTARLSSQDALDAFSADPARFDLVITDQTMPRMTGDQLTARLLAIRPDLPIILCTGFSSVIDEPTAKSLGIRAFLLKPIIRHDMAVTIRRVLDGKKTAMPAPATEIS